MFLAEHTDSRRIAIILLYYHVMFDFQERKRIRRVVYSRPMLAVLVLAFVLLAHATWGVYLKYRSTATNEALAKKDEATLRARADVLAATVARLSTAQGKEEEIRTKYGFTKAGEGVIVIVDPTSTVPISSPQESMWSKFLKAMAHFF